MIEVFNSILSASSLAYWLVGMMTLACAVLINIMTGSQALALVFLLPVWFGGLTGIFAFQEFGIFLFPDREPNLIAGALSGQIAAVLLMLPVIKAFYSLSDIKKPVTKADGHRA
jgi:hypothetical protein